MKANQKARENKAVSTVLGTILMIPIIFMIISAIMFWAQDLIDQMKKFQEKQKDVVNDINVVLTHIDEEFYIIWHESFEGTNLQWDYWNDAGGSPPDKVKTDNTQYFGGIQSGYIEADATDSMTIGKEFAWEGHDKISIEFYFTVDPTDDGSRCEDYKIFRISQKLKNEPNEKNIGEIQIDINSNPNSHEADILFKDETGAYTEILADVPLYASPKCWHHIKISVNFDVDGGNPKYSNLIFDGIETEFSNDLLYNHYPISGTNPVEYTKVEYGVYNSGSLTSSSYVDDFFIRYIPDSI